MILLIGGASHTGKTALAQRLLETYRYPYLSIDHLKMGLIRSGQTELTALSSDEALTAYLWPIVREMVKTAVENRQNLIVEGCYIPFGWEAEFSEEYLREIRCIRLVMSEDYIRRHFDDITAHASTVEQRLDDAWCTAEALTADNRRELALCRAYGADYIYIEESYDPDVLLAAAGRKITEAAE